MIKQAFTALLLVAIIIGCVYASCTTTETCVGGHGEYTGRDCP